MYVCMYSRNKHLLKKKNIRWRTLYMCIHFILKWSSLGFQGRKEWYFHHYASLCIRGCFSAMMFPFCLYHVFLQFFHLRIRCKILYLLFLNMCARYEFFRFFIVNISCRLTFIVLNTSSLKTLAVNGIFRTRRYIHISKAFNVLSLEFLIVLLHIIGQTKCSSPALSLCGI